MAQKDNQRHAGEAESVNEVLQDHAIRRHVDLIRHENAIVRKVIAVLNRSDADMTRKISEALAKGSSDAKLFRLDTMLQSIRAINAQAYAAAQGELTSALQPFADHEAVQLTAMLETITPKPVQAFVTFNATSGNQVYAAAMSRPFQGRLLKEWMTDMEAGRAKRVRDAIRIGIIENEPNEAIVRSIRGTRAAGYSDGILELPRQELRTVVQTATAHVAQFARQMTANANEDIIKALQWVATLDTHTCIRCASRDGETFTVATHKPVGGKNLPWLGGPGAIHFNCRCTSTFVLKSASELGLPDLSPQTRASMDGKVPAKLTFSEWLAKQPLDRVRDVLGPTRMKLYEKGGLDLKEFLNDRGRILTLAQLRERDAAAFRRAGL